MHPLLTTKIGEKLLVLGNEAIVRGAVEAGIVFSTTYPGTPASEIGDNLFQISSESDIYFEYSTNEKVALETAAGAAVSGVRAMCSMKHVGLNVAADSLMTLAYVGVRAGLVIVTADDPSLFSSQNEQDNRLYARFANIPMLEPSSAQEAKDMTVAAFDISERLELPVLLRTTTRLNHSRGVITTGTVRSRKTRGEFIKEPMRFVSVPAVSRVRHKVLLVQAQKAKEMACESSFNTITGKGDWGVVTSGVTYNYVSDGILELGIKDRVSLLKLGFTHPFPDQYILEFLRGVKKVLVVEELEPYIEDELRKLAHKNGLTIPILGKGIGMFSQLYEYDPGMVKKAIADVFGVAYTPPEAISIPEDQEGDQLPVRPPNLCAGCPHRATFYAANKAIEEMKTEAIFTTDIGCYTLGLLPPLRAADFLICMGSSITSAAGISRATGKNVIAYIGDSTFFHSGIPGLINAVHNRHRFVLVILDNGTTAMTGHQPHPGVEITPPNWDKPSISIENIVRGCGVKDVFVVNPLNLNRTKDAFIKAIESDSLTVIIAKSPCPLYQMRVLGTKKKRSFVVGPDCNTDCRECIDTLGCPALYRNNDPERKTTMVINQDLCIGCGVCIQMCRKIRPKRVKE